MAKPKGCYTIPDEVLNDIIRDLVNGMKIAEACEKYQVSRGSLYYRFKQKGLGKVGSFIRLHRLNNQGGE